MELEYSFIIPVFNRPTEVRELLDSMSELIFDRSFEVVVVEDGSSIDSKKVVGEYSGKLNIRYFQKPNTGPGDSRNFGMQRASGNYFLILDSDVILPPYYLQAVDNSLSHHFVHCFGGPDAAHGDFSVVQKAINYSMTSFLTTGGIRGGERSIGKFQPRSFNMGLSKEAFGRSGGYGSIHPGEDPDLALRLQELQYETKLIPEAYVYHKRRIDWSKFYRQVYKFGLVRPILNQWHPHSASLAFWFPAVFSLGLIASLLLFSLGFPWFAYVYVGYLAVILLHSLVVNMSVRIALCSLWAVLVQFFGYGFGFCIATCYIRFLKEPPTKRFPQLFFQNGKKTEDLNQNPV